MSDQDIRMTEGFGIDPIMKKRLDSQEINSVVELLKEFWKTKSCPAYIYYDNPRAYIPRVQKTKDFINIFVCSRKHPSDYKLQIAIAILKSMNGDYNRLPGLSADDIILINCRIRPINNLEAQEAKCFLKWLFDEYEIT